MNDADARIPKRPFEQATALLRESTNFFEVLPVTYGAPIPHA